MDGTEHSAIYFKIGHCLCTLLNTLGYDYYFYYVKYILITFGSQKKKGFFIEK